MLSSMTPASEGLALHAGLRRLRKGLSTAAGESPTSAAIDTGSELLPGPCRATFVYDLRRKDILMATPLLDRVRYPSDLRNLSAEQLRQVADAGRASGDILRTALAALGVRGRLMAAAP